MKKTKVIQCIDCGEWIEVEIDNKRTCRCEECQHQKQLEYQRISMKKIGIVRCEVFKVI